MSIPTGGAGGFAGGAGAGADATNALVPKKGSDAAAASAKGSSAQTGEAAADAGKDTSKGLAQKAVAGGISGAAGGPAGIAAGAAKGVAAEAVKTKLGVGGTSEAGDPENANRTVPRNLPPGAGKAAIAAAVPAAGVGGKLIFLAMLLNYLKSLFFAAAALAMNLVNFLLGTLVAAGKAIVGGVMSIGAGVSGFFGGAVSAVVAGVSTVTTASLVAAAGIVTLASGMAGNVAQKDELIADCSIEVAAAAKATGSDSIADSPETMLSNAKLVYSVLSAWGMPDENIAGILGNWDAESGIDPTGVETIMGEAYRLGQQKKAAEDKGFDVSEVAPEYGKEHSGVKLLGIGLGQWSNDRNTHLRDYAKASSGSWATLETQLGFMISKDSGAPVIKHMISTPIGSASEAAVYFHNEWERSADSSTGKREAAAVKWFARMGGWAKNQALADSILAQSGSTLDKANGNRVSAAKEQCLTDTKTQTVNLKQGGLNLDEAEALMATYRSEGESVLVGAFGSGGPGDCGYGKSDNCVGFSAYFMYKFTSFKQYAAGNGIRTAAAIAEMTDRETSTTPKPYSVFSMETDAPEGHTGVILGIQGDKAVIGEASCGSNHTGTRAFTLPLSELTGGGYVFTDVSDLITDEAMG